MSKFLILHGTGGSPKSNWFMWLKGVLIGQGHEVWLPQLPNSETPDAHFYNHFLLSNQQFEIDAETTIIGHSSGAVEILSLLQNLPPNKRIKAAILVSAFKDNLATANLDGMFVEPFDFVKIKSVCDRITFIHSDNDPYVPLDHAKFLAEELDADLIVFEEQGHFNTEVGPQYKQFPELLEFIDY